MKTLKCFKINSKAYMTNKIKRITCYE